VGDSLTENGNGDDVNLDGSGQKVDVDGNGITANYNAQTGQWSATGANGQQESVTEQNGTTIIG
jgi:hypothetical protein